MVLKKFKIDPLMLNVIVDASVVGLHMVSHTLVGGAMGYFLDRWLDTKPTLFMICILLGIASGFMSMYRDMKRILRKLEIAGAPGRKPGDGAEPAEHKPVGERKKSGAEQHGKKDS